jgi:hypothetical protein
VRDILEGVIMAALFLAVLLLIAGALEVFKWVFS